MKELEQFLLDRAMEHDSPTLLFNLAREYLASAKVMRPNVFLLAKMIGTARKGAGDLTAQLVGHLLTGEVRADLDRMLLVDAGLGMTRLEWLNSPARDASASSVKTAIDKLAWFRGIDAPRMDVSRLPNERRRFLAQVACRSTNQGLERWKERKYPILLAFVFQPPALPLPAAAPVGYGPCAESPASDLLRRLAAGDCLMGVQLGFMGVQLGGKVIWAGLRGCGCGAGTGGQQREAVTVLP